MQVRNLSLLIFDFLKRWFVSICLDLSTLIAYGKCTENRLQHILTNNRKLVCNVLDSKIVISPQRLDQSL